MFRNVIGSPVRVRTAEVKELERRIQNVCGPELVLSRYRRLRPDDAHRTWGCCYIAAEAMYHLYGKERGFRPVFLKYPVAGSDYIGNHVFLRNGDEILDPTAEQFKGKEIDYDAGRSGTFMTVEPSKRCQTIMTGVQCNPTKEKLLTPIETHNGFLVKRDDSYEVAGIRGGKGRICWELSEGQKGLVVSGSRQSLLVNIAAHVAEKRGIHCRGHVPTGLLTPELEDAVEHGIELVKHKMGYPNVLMSNGKKDAEARGWREIPFGLECWELVADVSKQVRNIPKEAKRIVVPVGSGMTLSGILTGLVEQKRKTKVLGVIVGGGKDHEKFSPVLERRMNKFSPPNWKTMVEFVHSGVPYATEAKQVMLGDLQLDSVYEAKCLPHLKKGDLLWVVGIRQTEKKWS